MNAAFRAEVSRPTPVAGVGGGADRAAVEVVRMHGLLDRSATDEMTGVRARLVGSGLDVLVLDLADVSYLSSTGIALLVGVLAEARSEGIEVRASGLSDHYRHIFELTRLVELMTCYPDERSAVAGVAPVADG